MPAKFITTDLADVIAERSLPGITVWNRLEGRPRTERFDRALRAEVRDALWMLTRQWQLGEFRGDDAGSPVVAKLRFETTRLNTYRPADGLAEPFDDAFPLEAKVERMPVSFRLGAHPLSLDLRLLLGRQWLKLVAPLGATVRDEYVGAYPIHRPDPLQPGDAPTVAHRESWANAAAVSGRRMDGAKLYEYLEADASHRASDGIPAVGGSAAVDALGRRFVAWFDRLISQPTSDSAWLPDRLEYQFACAAPGREGEKVLVAAEYYQGHLDWYSLDVAAAGTTLGGPDPAAQPSVAETLSMLPTNVRFNGMPNTRWWAFEDGKTNFGDVKPDTTDLAKLLLIEFGLVYANDWFLVPLTLPVGAVATVRGLAVTNVFGERVWVEAAGRGDDDDWQRWAMFLLSVDGTGHEPADLALVIPPVAAKVQNGDPLEAVTLARDEMANSVWAIEDTIPLPSGEPKVGREAANETRAFFEEDLERRIGAPPAPPPYAEGASIRYRVMSSVPENWIPMIPVHVPGDVREIQLQRAAMLRILEGDPDAPVPVRPRTSLLRSGLDRSPPTPYFLHEEEVTRASVRVTGSFQRTRARDGRAVVWLGVRKLTGRGESSSGLAFDMIVDKPAG